MKKILALILSVLLVLCVFSGCGNGRKKINDKDAVQALACEYVELLFDGSEAALDYVMQDTAPYVETQNAIATIASFNSLSGALGIPEKDAEKFNELVQEFYREFVNDIKCNVKNVTIEEGVATVTAEVLLPLTEELGGITNKIREEGRIEALLTEEEMAEYEKNGFSIRYAELVFEEVLKEFDGKCVAKEITFEMEKSNGDWKIVYIEGDLF